MNSSDSDRPDSSSSGRSEQPGEGHTLVPKNAVAACSFPHHKLVAYQLALELVRVVASVRIRDPHLRAQARKSAASTALNCAEGAARQSSGEKSRMYGIALAECCEACAAVEIAEALGACSSADLKRVLALGVRVKNVLSRLVR